MWPRAARVVPSSLSLLTHALHALSPAPSLSLAAVQDGELPKDYATTAAIKEILAKAYEEAIARWIGDLKREHGTAKAAVAAGVDRKKIVQVAMEDGDVMAWLLATIPEYAKETGLVRGSSPLSRRSLASLACVCASPSLSRHACATHAIRVFCVCCHAQLGWLPLHFAAGNSESEAVIMALLDAYPDAAKEKGEVRCGRGRRLLCPLLSLLTCVCVAVCSMGGCRSTGPLGRTSQRR